MLNALSLVCPRWTTQASVIPSPKAFKLWFPLPPLLLLLLVFLICYCQDCVSVVNTNVRLKSGWLQFVVGRGGWRDLNNLITPLALSEPLQQLEVICHMWAPTFVSALRECVLTFKLPVVSSSNTGRCVSLLSVLLSYSRCYIPR
jgi:hypothetical protein